MRKRQHFRSPEMCPHIRYISHILHFSLISIFRYFIKSIHFNFVLWMGLLFTQCVTGSNFHISYAVPRLWPFHFSQLWHSKKPSTSITLKVTSPVKKNTPKHDVCPSVFKVPSPLTHISFLQKQKKLFICCCFRLN